MSYLTFIISIKYENYERLTSAYTLCFLIMIFYVSGRPLPQVDYSALEIQTWGNVFRQLMQLYPTHACHEHRHVFPLLIENCGYQENAIPQLEDVSNFLKGT